MEQSFPHTLLYCLTNFLPDRCSTGPAIPRGGFPPVRGIPDYESSALLAGALPDIPEPLFRSLHIHSQSRIYKDVWAFTVLLFYVSGLSPYCCSTCPGFHHTAVLRVRAFTVLLFYVSGLSPYCCSTPIWTIHKQVSPWILSTIHRTQSPNTCILN